ncbi:c-type cytochrome [Pelagibius marinus]|uniref:c-type cytochrome n=1 Tax=Pelagibius marinus TaxID=2762760 RepID=UPI001872B8F7|nr:cytochrome c family protein [Pelagibius marinus]
MRVRSALSIITFTLIAALAGPAFAEGDAAKGEKVFRKCKACHAVEEGKNKVGPSLFNIVGRTPGTVEDFRYSKAMEAFGADGHVWDEETLASFLEKPKDLVDDTKMAFVGLKKPEDRADVIAYLKQFSE